MTQKPSCRIKITSCILYFTCLFGCAQKIVLSNQDFLIITASSNDSFASLAQQYMGSSAKADILRRYNPKIELHSGVSVAIPKHVLNTSGVFYDGYQVVPILCYHQFTDADNSNSKMVVTTREFESHMEYLAEQGYSVINLDDLHLFWKGELTLPKKSVVLTVDDGYKSFYQFALPILEKYNFQSTLFVYTGFVGGGAALSWQEIKQLEANPLVSIESHSSNHSNLSQKSGSETLAAFKSRVQKEVGGAHAMFKKKLNKEPKFYAYPYGDSSTQAIDALKTQGYAQAFTVERGVNSTFTAQYMFNRSMVYGGQPLSKFKGLLKTFEPIQN